MPFATRKRLWDLVQAEVGLAIANGKTQLSGIPSYSMFRRIVAGSDLKRQLVFQRVVYLSRCAQCEFLRKAIASDPTNLKFKEDFGSHHWVQIQEKRTYWRDAAIAANGDPHLEMYLVHDGGAGREFHFPHISPYDNKPVKGIQPTRHLKVQNIMHHGGDNAIYFGGPDDVCDSGWIIESIARFIANFRREKGFLPPGSWLPNC